MTAHFCLLIKEQPCFTDTYWVANQLNISIHLYVFNWTTFANRAFLELSSQLRHCKAVDKNYWTIIIVIIITLITTVIGGSQGRCIVEYLQGIFLEERVLFNHLSVNKELLIMSLIIFSVFLLVAFFGRRVLTGLEGPNRWHNTFSESRFSESLL